MVWCVPMVEGLVEGASGAVQARVLTAFSLFHSNLRRLYKGFALGPHRGGAWVCNLFPSGALPLRGVAGSHLQDPFTHLEAECFSTLSVG